MSNDTITFTIPMTPDALMRTGLMLYGMAEDLGGSAVGEDDPQQSGGNIIPTMPVSGGNQSDEQQQVAASRHVDYQTHEQDEGRAVGEAERTAEPPDTDQYGVPWDSRIHASSKTLTADGCWRQRRGISKDYREQIEQELKTPVVPPPAPAKAEQPAPPPAPAPGKWDELDFMGLMTKCTEQKVPQETAIAVIQKVSEGQITSLPGLVSRPDLIPQIAAELLE